MADLVDMHGRVLERFGLLVHEIEPDDWSRPTPCSDWDVRALVGHLVEEQLWVPPLMAGTPMEAAEGQVPSGDPLGDDPVAAWDAAAPRSRDAVAKPDALTRTVHLSRGQAPAREYVGELTFDLLIHGWDLARAIGRDEQLDQEAVQMALEVFEPNAEEWAATGLFGAAVPVPADADEATRLIALTGRQP